jgi:hypothetical protein
LLLQERAFRLLVALVPAMASVPVARSQTVSVGFASIQTEPTRLDGALGVEGDVRLRLPRFPGALLAGYRYVRQVDEAAGMTCDTYWPSYDNCVDETTRSEASLSTWTLGVYFEDEASRRARFGGGVGFEISRVSATERGLATGREIPLAATGQTIGAGAIFLRAGIAPRLSWPLEVQAGIRFETPSWGDCPTDIAGGVCGASGLLGWSVGLGYRIGLHP